MAVYRSAKLFLYLISKIKPEFRLTDSLSYCTVANLRSQEKAGSLQWKFENMFENA